MIMLHSPVISMTYNKCVATTRTITNYGNVLLEFAIGMLVQ